jgi:hypothetical protein
MHAAANTQNNKSAMHRLGPVQTMHGTESNRNLPSNQLCSTQPTYLATGQLLAAQVIPDAPAQLAVRSRGPDEPLAVDVHSILGLQMAMFWGRDVGVEWRVLT